MYPHHAHLLGRDADPHALGLARGDHRIQAEIRAAAMRQREAGELAYEQRPSLADRLRAGVRIVTRRRAVAFG